jgi:hypothetical protein
MSELQSGPSLAECYPEGVPESFPAALFEPAQGDLVFREQSMQLKIDAVQAELAKMPQAPTPVRNTFAGGCYSREVFIPKGTLVIGKLHLTDHLNIFLQGDLTFLTPDGPKRMKAPALFASPAGTKKLAYANEDSVWVNVHQAISDDPEEIISALTVDTYMDYERLVSGASMRMAIERHGFTSAQVLAISNDEDTFDSTPQPGVEVYPSELHGLGLFATQDFSAGSAICPGTVDGKRSVAGRYSNHHHTPNCEFQVTDDGLVLFALCDIVAGAELTTDYGHTLDVIAGMKEHV